METRALRFHGAHDLRTQTVPLRAAGEGEVTVEVDACAICESDLAFLAGTARPRRMPVTLGHEVAGTVSESRAAGWKAGDRVVITAGSPCRDCVPCRTARINLCARLVLLGVDVDGGLAERVVVPGSALVRRPDGIEAPVAATADAAAAAYHALARRGGLCKGHGAVIVGAGVPGGYAIQIAKLLGAAPVIAVDDDETDAARARSLGADEVLIAGRDRSIGRDIKLLTDGGADVAVDFAGSSATVDVAVKSLRPGGVAVTAGLGSDPVTAVPTVLWSLYEYELRGAFGSLPGDLDRVLEWLAGGAVVAPPLDPVPLADAAPAIAARVGRRRHDRLVVLP